MINNFVIGFLVGFIYNFAAYSSILTAVKNRNTHAGATKIVG